VKLADPHIRMGLVAGDGGVVAWPSNMAGTLARRHLLWGIPILAEDAHRIGMVTDLVDTPDEVRPLALELAAQVAALPPVAVQLTKRAMNKVTSAQAEDAFDLGFYLEAMTLGSADMQEAVTAFLAKRKPTWRGR
jgi:enoyl-CoA hydratase/carnithine racemase